MYNHASKRANVIVVVFVACLMVLSACLISYAEEVVGYTTSKFNIKVYADRLNTVSYSESIVLNFANETDTFVRQLPESTIGRVSEVTVDGYEYSFDEKNNAITIHSKTAISGKKSFTIKYKVTGIPSEIGKKDSLDIILVPDNWPTSIESSKIQFKYDANLKWDNIRYIIGNSSSKMTKYGDWDDDGTNNIVKFNGNNIPANTKMEIIASFPEGYWAYNEGILWTRNTAELILLIGIAMFVLMRILFGKEPQLKIIDSKYPPEGYPPAIVGKLIDDYVDDIDITATILEMARRGYMNINEYEKDKFEFTYVKFPSNERHFIKTLFNGFFSNVTEYSTVKLEDIAPQLKKACKKAGKEAGRMFGGGRFGFTAASSLANNLLTFAFLVVTAAVPMLNVITKSLDKTAIIEGAVMSVGIAGLFAFLLNRVLLYYRMMNSRRGDGNSIRFKALSAIYVICAIAYSIVFRFSFNGSAGEPIIIALSLAFLVIVPLMLFGMKGRSKDALEIIGKAKGLENWILNASKEETKQIADQDEDNDYFFKLFPYAMIFGNTKKLIRDFEYVSAKVPSWYKPYGVEENSDLDVVVLNAMVTNFKAALNKEVYGK